MEEVDETGSLAGRGRGAAENGFNRIASVVELSFRFSFTDRYSGYRTEVGAGHWSGVAGAECVD